MRRKLRRFFSVWRRKSRRALMAENERLRQDNATLRLLTKAYMRRNAKLEEDVAALNASLDCCRAEQDRWAGIARKADERRVAYVREHMVGAD